MVSGKLYILKYIVHKLMLKNESANLRNTGVENMSYISELKTVCFLKLGLDKKMVPIV